MIGNKCHIAVLVFLLCLFDNNVRGASVINVTGEKSSTSAPLIQSTVANTDAVISNVASTQLGTSTIKPSDVPNTPVKPTAVKDDVTVSPDITPSTVPADPDNTTTTSTTPASTTSKTTLTTPTTQTTSTSSSTTTTTTTTPVTPITTKSTASTSPSPVTSTTPTTTVAPAPHHSRQFDGPSFIGGIVLASGLMAIGFVAFKFYKARTERNYHTL
ncbi:hypothetical protein ILUMI_21258 [Ignelater luminosus]|uniref:Sialomucin core protein 24 n=1 Tax=Ignelater luminosus TaxID=2038154 RepID=A0A8K0CJ39_IGNLU|nr:hypothetical protein ILUMI_21258 [Ignelater luminosus]